MNLPDRIETKIVRIPFSGCWIWMGAAARYGHTHVNGKSARAHRAIYEMSGNFIPAGMELMHSCDIGLCVNPDHLSIGTHQDNMADMVRKGRARAPIGDAHWTRNEPERARAIAQRNIVKSHASGIDNSNAKVTLLLLPVIRAAYATNPNQTMAELGKPFGLGRETARKIVKGIAPWKL